MDTLATTNKCNTLNITFLFIHTKFTTWHYFFLRYFKEILMCWNCRFLIDGT